jgi:hypothetical protein
MPGWKICLKPSHGREKCFYIPVIIDREVWPPHPPDPGPLHHEWIEVEQEETWAADLRVLATVDRVAHLASPDLRKRLQDVARTAAPDIAGQAPEGIALHMGR